jgi:hypothetical protein
MNNEDCNLKKITLDGVEYVRHLPILGKRAVLVLDRGWIVVGDVTDVGGRIHVTRALHIRNWTEIGFDGMIADPKSKKVTIKPLPNGFDVPADAELFRVPVSDDWGL